MSFHIPPANLRRPSWSAVMRALQNPRIHGFCISLAGIIGGVNWLQGQPAILPALGALLIAELLSIGDAIIYSTNRGATE